MQLLNDELLTRVSTTDLKGRTILYSSVIVLKDSAAKQFLFSIICRKEDVQLAVERPLINSAILSVNLRPLTKKVFKDPVVITLRHSVVSTPLSKRARPMFA